MLGIIFIALNMMESPKKKTSGMMLYVIFDVSSCGARSRQVCFKKVD